MKKLKLKLIVGASSALLNTLLASPLFATATNLMFNRGLGVGINLPQLALLAADTVPALGWKEWGQGEDNRLLAVLQRYRQIMAEFCCVKKDGILPKNGLSIIASLLPGRNARQCIDRLSRLRIRKKITLETVDQQLLMNVLTLGDEQLLRYAILQQIRNHDLQISDKGLQLMQGLLMTPVSQPLWQAIPPPPAPGVQQPILQAANPVPHPIAPQQTAVQQVASVQVSNVPPGQVAAQPAIPAPQAAPQQRRTVLRLPQPMVALPPQQRMVAPPLPTPGMQQPRVVQQVTSAQAPNVPPVQVAVAQPTIPAPQAAFQQQPLPFPSITINGVTFN